jgi:hypothetical protein
MADNQSLVRHQRISNGVPNEKLRTLGSSHRVYYAYLDVYFQIILFFGSPGRPREPPSASPPISPPFASANELLSLSRLAPVPAACR